MMDKTEQKCDDPHCPEHGHLKLRGRSFEGKVVSDKMDKTAVVEWSYAKDVEKYERYARNRTRVSAHNPNCIDAEEGDIVEVKECKPISKTKRFAVNKIIEKRS